MMVPGPPTTSQKAGLIVRLDQIDEVGTPVGWAGCAAEGHEAERRRLEFHRRGRDWWRGLGGSDIG